MRLVLVVNDVEIVGLVAVDIRVLGVDHQSGRLVIVPLAFDHFEHLLDMVEIDVSITEGKRQAARCAACGARKQVQQEGIARNIEGRAKGHIPR